MGIQWAYAPEENPDWDFARNKQILLRTDRASFSQSLFSCNMGQYICPNRDYHHQGFSLHLPQNTWKYLDAMAIAVKVDGSPEPLDAKDIIVRPFDADYNYETPTFEIKVNYALMNARTSSACLISRITTRPRKAFGKASMQIMPLVDMRPASGSSTSLYDFGVSGETMQLFNGNKALYLSIDTGNSMRIFPSPKYAEWDYKLGSGFRKEDGGTRFGHEQRTVVSFCEFGTSLPKDKNTFHVISTAGFDDNINASHSYCIQHYQNNRKRLRDKESGISRKFKAQPEILARAMTLTTFMQYPDELFGAGDYWFNQVWYRDLLEGLIHNRKTLMKIQPHAIPNALEKCAAAQDQILGLMPNFQKTFGSTDATLLYFILAGEYLKERKDSRAAEASIRAAKAMVSAFESDPKKRGGAPFVQGNLLYANPASSWTDSIVNGHPARIPEQWGPLPYVLLPELNAQWIVALKSIKEIAASYDNPALAKKAGELLSQSVIKFKRIFHNPNTHYPFNAVTQGKRDPTISSSGLVAAVLLHGIAYNRAELKQMMPALTQILVHRKGQLFGMLVKAGKSPYYGDREYHGSVMWPRDSPYLIKYFKLIGKHTAAEEIMENMIDHQMQEGCILYNHELFSLPLGNNTYPTHQSVDPVPVKDPAQFWSHWCDPYLEE